MRAIVLVMLMLALAVSAKTKVVTDKVLKADTTVTVKCDTIKTVLWDTVMINKTVQDTSILMKADTVVKAAKRPVASVKK